MMAAAVAACLQAGDTSAVAGRRRSRAGATPGLPVGFRLLAAVMAGCQTDWDEVKLSDLMRATSETVRGAGLMDVRNAVVDVMADDGFRLVSPFGNVMKFEKEGSRRDGIKYGSYGSEPDPLPPPSHDPRTPSQRPLPEANSSQKRFFVSSPRRWSRMVACDLPAGGDDRACGTRAFSVERQDFRLSGYAFSSPLLVPFPGGCSLDDCFRRRPGSSESGLVVPVRRGRGGVGLGS